MTSMTEAHAHIHIYVFMYILNYLLDVFVHRIQV